MTKHLRWQILSAILLISLSICSTSCRKVSDQKGDPKAIANTPMSSIRAGEISLWDIYQKLPKTIAYNLSDSIRFDTSRVEWIYRSTGLLLRIPTATGNNSWMYVFQPFNTPEDLKVYAVRFLLESGDGTKFTGKQVWIDLQTWKGYAVDYVNNVPTAFLQPQELAYQEWETCMLDHGDFYLDVSGKIKFNDGEQAGVGMKPTGGDGCGGLIGPQRKSLWDMLGGFFGRIFTGRPGDGNWTGFGIAPPIWIPPNGLPDGDGYGGGGGGGGSSPYEPPAENPVITPPNHAGNAFNTVEDPGGTVPALWVVEGPLTGSGSGPLFIGVENPTVGFVGSMLGLNQQKRNWLLQHLDKATAIRDFLISNLDGITLAEKKTAALKHLDMMIQYPDYLDYVNNFEIENPTINVPILDLTTYVFTPQANAPISNITEYLKCFENIAGATYKITVAVAQPQPGTRKPFKLLSGGEACNVGHTFLILEQTANGVTTTRSMGWYPAGFCTPFNPVDPGVINNDQSHFYNISLTTNVSATHFMSIVNDIKVTFGGNYDLNQWNCTAWAVTIVSNYEEMENVPGTRDFWPAGWGMNPGDLGEDIRSLQLQPGQSRNTTGGNAPVNQGTCP